MFQHRSGAIRRHHRDPHRGTRHPVGHAFFGDLHHGGDDVPFILRELFGRRGRRQAVRRGEVRPLILALLTRKPMHGYEIIQELEAQSGGRWRPSAGSVYPTLQQLADEGLVTSEEVDGRRTYALTDAGRVAAAEAPEPPAWDDLDAGADPDLRKLGIQLLQAVIQVQRVGSPHARREVNGILADARRAIYRLLADDGEAAEDGEAASV